MGFPDCVCIRPDLHGHHHGCAYLQRLYRMRPSSESGSGETRLSEAAALLAVEELIDDDQAIELDVIDGGVVMKLEDVPEARLVEELARRQAMKAT